MKLSQSNPFLRSFKDATSGLWISAKTSSAIEGIRQPFVDGAIAFNPPTTAALIEYWKQRASKSA